MLQLISKVLTCSPRPQRCDCSPQGPHEVPSGCEFVSRAAFVSTIAFFFPSPSSKLQGSSPLSHAQAPRSTSSGTPGLFSAFISLVHRKIAVRPSEELNRFSKLQTTSKSVPEHPYGPSDELRRRAHAETTPKSFAFSLGTNGRVQRRPGSGGETTGIQPPVKEGSNYFQMSLELNDSDFCLECHWEAFQMAGKNPMLSGGHDSQSQWCCPPDETHDSHACTIDEACCDVDHCSVACGSVCDGFVDCDNSTVCSESHCEDQNCESTGPVCFDKHCFEDSHEGQSLEALLGEDIQLNWDTPGFLPSTSAPGNESSQAQKPEDPFHHHTVDFRATDELFASLSTPAHNAQHHDSCHSVSCQAPSKESSVGLSSPSYSSQSDLASLGTCDVLGVGHGYLSCGHHIHGVHPLLPDSNMERFFGLPPSVAAPCSNAAHQHVGNRLRTPAATGVHGFHGVCRSHAHGHTHCHSHPYMPYARHHRSSVSSHLMSSPADTPPPLEGGISSGLTSPTFPTDDHEPHICKWTFNHDGMKIACGASFADAGALQEHLVSKHMGTMDGRKGHGYYCCWEGCHRPDEPFSQKSKLQGHFLTHSNFKSFKCSVCSKPFARQATLERHERSHRGEKPYKCRECGKAFTDSSELKTHSRTHSGEKPFKCNYPGCNFQTGDSSNMSSHKLTHGERRHKCQYPGCTKSFTRPDQLKRHLRTTHKDERGSTLTSPMAEQFMTAAFDSLA
ncbi:transcriptional regulator family: C2H2 zinc finger [Paecilomyces variotii]|nr:transcriptional regulator family: C2H2 zinc finger [Paecilomyces variotii]